MQHDLGSFIIITDNPEVLGKPVCNGKMYFIELACVGMVCREFYLDIRHQNQMPGAVAGVDTTFL